MSERSLFPGVVDSPLEGWQLSTPPKIEAEPGSVLGRPDANPPSRKIMSVPRVLLTCLCLVLTAVPAWAQTEPAPTSGAAPVAPADSVDDSGYAVRLRGLEERVNDLKERIFRSKARLILLKETVLNGVISGAKANIVHRNEMGSSFALEQVSYALDGAPLFNKTDTTGELDEQEEIELFNGSIVPGTHNLSVYLLYRGNGYGVFSYLKGYSFKIKSSHAFTAEEGKVTNVKVVAYERGGFTTDLKDRPAIRYDMEVKADVAGPAPAEGGE